MEFRLCRDAEYTAVRQLWGQCFGEEEPWTSWYFSMHYQAAQTWVGLDAGTVVAQTHLLPHRLRLRGNWRDAVYIVGVCVDETRRNQGIGREILATALAQLRCKGVGISILQPRWPIFYQKLGWDYCYSRQAFRLPVEAAKLLLSEIPADLTWLPDTREINVLAGLYENFVRPRHGYALRTEKDWESLTADHFGAGGRAGLLFRQEIPCGYALYSSIESCLNVRELVWSEAADSDMFWKYLIDEARLSGDENIEWMDPSEDQGSPLSPGAPSEGFLMGRLTDVAVVLEAINYPVNLTADLELVVNDPLAPWNDGRFHWSIRGGQAQFVSSESIRDPDLEIGIGTLSQLVFGQHPARQIVSAESGGGCREEVIELLTQIFPARRNFISEFF